ncbi:MAG: hypothetical protein ACHQJ7_11970, partial [Vicinamibacteria bacterium]
PTARELLEQADALMRRNRQEAAHGARESAMQGTRSVAPDLAVAPVPQPVAKATPAMPAHAKVEAPPPIVRDDDDNIPLLKDVVRPPSARASDDDVPVLTDAVDEIDVAAPDVDEGEPSDWLTPPAEDESVLGPAPPSVAVVPPATLPSTPRPHREAPPHARTPDIEDLSQRVYADHDADVTVRRAVPTLGAPPAPPSIPEIEDLAEASLADVDPDVTWTRPISTPAVASALVAAREMPAAPREEPPPATGSPMVPTGAEFEALAEEIRMQVLQRIDMFTDTGLRERLGERLKPIVDRASADLVDAINQHVGEILRAYVAEAIEREIDRWKSGR